MSFDSFRQFQTDIPTDDEVAVRLEQQQELLAQAMLPLYQGLSQQLDDQQDAIDAVRRRASAVVKKQNGAVAKLLEPVTGQLVDYVTSSTGEQQSMIDLSQARMAAQQAIATPKSPIPNPTGPLVQYIAWYNCTTGDRQAQATVDNVKRSQLAASGYLEYKDRLWNDPYSPLAFWDSQVGQAWIQVHCNPQSQPPIGSPPPPVGPPPPIGTPPQGKWRVYLLCVNGTPAWAPLAPGADLPTDPQYAPYVIVDGLQFDSGEDTMFFLQHNSPSDHLPPGFACTGVTTTLPPGCCPSPDLWPYVKFLCQCIKDSCEKGNADLDQPLLFLFDERGEAWRQQAINWYGPTFAGAVQADSMGTLNAYLKQLING